jgi:hypothetical protein
MLNALRLGLGVVAGFFLAESESAGTETSRVVSGTELPPGDVESTLAGAALLLSWRRESGGVTVVAESVVSCPPGRLRGITMARGVQSLGSTSQSGSSSTVCCATASAELLPQPSTKTVRNAVVMVERNLGVTGRQQPISPNQERTAMERDRS